MTVTTANPKLPPPLPEVEMYAFKGGHFYFDEPDAAVPAEMQRVIQLHTEALERVRPPIATMGYPKDLASLTLTLTLTLTLIVLLHPSTWA